MLRIPNTQPDSEVSYLVSNVYAPEAAAGVRYDDPALGIAWPLPVTKISARDKTWPDLSSGANNHSEPPMDSPRPASTPSLTPSAAVTRRRPLT